MTQPTQDCISCKALWIEFELCQDLATFQEKGCARVISYWQGSKPPSGKCGDDSCAGQCNADSEDTFTTPPTECVDCEFGDCPNCNPDDIPTLCVFNLLHGNQESEDSEDAKRYIFSGLKGDKGIATYDDLNNRYRIVSVQSLQSYIAFFDEPVPAAQKLGDTWTLGSRVAALWKRERNEDESTESFGAQLVPLRESPSNTCVRRRVYNSLRLTIPSCVPIEVVQDSLGDLYVTDRSAALPPAPATTTTTLPPCAGRCHWIWDVAANAWQLDSDGCTDITTTTSSTTTTPEGVTTTTLEPCGCETTTTSPPLSLASCNCIYPNHCGEEDGECTFTYCASGDVAVTIDCTTTTTTTTTTTSTTAGPCDLLCEQLCVEGVWTLDGDACPGSCECDGLGDACSPELDTRLMSCVPVAITPTTCDCNTTTTTLTPGCIDGCHWISLPIGVGTFGWHLHENGCSSECPCGLPTRPPVGCDEFHTDCVTTTTTTTYTPDFCDGKCIYYWVAPIETWFLLEADCEGNVPCSCVPPSAPPDECGEVTGGCQSPPTTTSTTTTLQPDPCASCYTTTTTTGTTTTTTAGVSTTTTTLGPCPDDCKWNWDSELSQWLLIDDPCSPACTCAEPITLGSDTCEVAWTECRHTTTTLPPTTTTLPPTTTTTTTTCPDCQTFSNACIYRYQNVSCDWVLESSTCPFPVCDCRCPDLITNVCLPCNPDFDDQVIVDCIAVTDPNNYCTCNGQELDPPFACPPGYTCGTLGNCQGDYGCWAPDCGDGLGPCGHCDFTCTDGEWVVDEDNCGECGCNQAYVGQPCTSEGESLDNIPCPFPVTTTTESPTTTAPPTTTTSSE